MHPQNQNGAAVDSGKGFMEAAGGSWAGERLLAMLRSGKPLSASALRTLDTLRKDEWKNYDDALVQEGAIRLRGVADLIARGLVTNIPNALGKTIHEWEKVSDMEEAVVSLDGTSRGNNDRVTFDLDSVPVPITHKDFNLSLRTLAASRERGEALDTTQARTAGRLVFEKLEKMLFQGGNVFGGKTIYGYTNHPQRNTGSFAANGDWAQSAKTGENMLTDLQNWKGALEADRMPGPYGLYLPSAASTKLDGDFKANSDKTIRERLLQVDGLEFISIVDQMPAASAVLVQLTSDVVSWGMGEDVQTVQWALGPLSLAFKAFAIQVPIVKSDAQGRSGVLHAS